MPLCKGCRACSIDDSVNLCFACTDRYFAERYVKCPISIEGIGYIGPMTVWDWTEMLRLEHLFTVGDITQEQYDEKIAKMCRHNNPEGLDPIKETERREREKNAMRNGVVQNFELPRRKVYQKHVAYDPSKR